MILVYFGWQNKQKQSYESFLKINWKSTIEYIIQNLIVEKMKIYTDVFTGVELISDSYEMVEIFNGIATEVKSQLIIKGEEKIDVGNCNHFGGAEEEEGGEVKEKVINIVDAFHYESTSFDKEGFQKYFKEYMKKILAHLQNTKPERVQPFKEGAKQFFKHILKNFNEYSFWTDSNFDMDNHITLSYYKDEEEAPRFIYIMDGLKFFKA